MLSFAYEFIDINIPIYRYDKCVYNFQPKHIILCFQYFNMYHWRKQKQQASLEVLAVWKDKKERSIITGP